VLVGTSTADDAAVYRLNDEQAIVATVDFFTPIVDDPYQFGRIAAANALSDIYAMGARPLFALGLVGFPRDRLPLEVLGEIQRGGADLAREAGVHILGGHSIDDPEPKYGLVAIGLVHPDRVLRNASARPGDRLVLTKPLGSGIVTTAIKRGLANPAEIERITALMATLNRAASEAMVAVGVDAATDVTGYGLLGHLRELAAGSGLDAELWLEAVPVLPEAWRYAREGVVPGGTRRNREAVADSVDFGDLDEVEQLVLCDAQTSGGLLIAVPPEREAALVSRLAEVGAPAAAVVGELGPGGGGIRVRRAAPR
jgi:selenide,water dikinase